MTRSFPDAAAGATAAPLPPLPGLRGLLLSERPRPGWVRSSPHGWWLAVAAVCFGAFMGQLDASVVTLTYGSLENHFHVGAAAVEWVSLAYLLTLTALLVPVGRLADGWGRKQVYLYGFAVFTAASAACGFAPGLGVLVALRALQAVGAAMLQANSVALVTTSAPPDRTRAALGVQAAAQALGLALGPTLGGVVVATVGWRWVFWLNVPVGVVAVVAGYYLLPRTRERTPVRGFDAAGTMLLATATTGLLLAVSTASGLPLPGWAPALLLAVAVGGGTGFVLRQRRAAAPTVDLRLLRGTGTWTGLLGALCGYLVLFGPLVLVPLTTAGGAGGGSVLGTGLLLTALPGGFALAALRGDSLVPRHWDAVRRCRVGAWTACAVLVVWTLLATDRPEVLAPLLVLLGLGLGVFTPANNAAVMRAIPRRAAGTAGGLVNMARGLGTAFGVAAVTLAVELAGPAHTGGGGATRAATAVLAVAAAVAGLSVARSGGPDRPAGPGETGPGETGPGEPVGRSV